MCGTCDSAGEWQDKIRSWITDRSAITDQDLTDLIGYIGDICSAYLESSMESEW